jgi:hypothetical protein
MSAMVLSASSTPPMVNAPTTLKSAQREAGRPS